MTIFEILARFDTKFGRWWRGDRASQGDDGSHAQKPVISVTKWNWKVVYFQRSAINENCWAQEKAGRCGEGSHLSRTLVKINHLRSKHAVVYGAGKARNLTSDPNRVGVWVEVDWQLWSIFSRTFLSQICSNLACFHGTWRALSFRQISAWSVHEKFIKWVFEVAKFQNFRPKRSTRPPASVLELVRRQRVRSADREGERGTDRLRPKRPVQAALRDRETVQLSAQGN